MSLITSAEIKSLLQISGSGYESIIASLLPIVRDFVVYDLCQNSFKRLDVYVQSSTISFAKASAKISDSDSNFVENGFTANNDIIVEGSIDNDGLYEVSVVTAADLTLDFTNHPGGALVDEAAGETIRITRVDFPRGLKLPVSQLFSHLLDQTQLKGLASEKIGSYSISYLSDLPKSLEKKFQPFKKVSW